MMQLVEANWPLFLVALLIGIAVAWFVFVATRRTRVETTKTDALDEGAEKTRRNQALIDAPSAAASAPPVPPATPGGLAGVGTAVAAAVEDEQLEQAENASAPSTETTGPDDLSRIKGVGPKLKALLASLGVTRFEQIANWDDAEIDRIDAQLGKFEGRIRRDDWVTQARFLAAGDQAGYESQFGKL